MKKGIALTGLLVITLLISGLSAQEANQKLYRIHVKDFNRIKTIEDKGVLVYNLEPGSYVDVLARPEQMVNLNIEGADVEFIANSFKELYQAQLELKTSPPFHNYQATMAELISVAARYPAITHLDTIGFSVGGRAICSLKISDNPNVDEDEPPIFFGANTHGNEVHSVEVALFQINYLLDNYGTNPEVTNWINSMEIWYVPLINPDGREAMRRTNDHGVDLNRNYSVGFTAVENHGPGAFSEPETRAIRDFVARFPPIMSLSYHTSGQYVLYSWTHTDEAAPDSAAMIYLGSLISESITFIANNRLTPYTLRQGGRWYFTAGEYCDYMYVTHNTLAFTIELGDSQAPDYAVVPAMVESNLTGMKTLLRQAGKAGVTGLISDEVSGLPVRATIDIPTINNQGKVPPRLADSLFGRYYRYLQPGTYTFHVSAPGYRTVIKEVVIAADSLVHWNLKLERSALLEVEDLVLTDSKTENTSGNGDGLVNLGEKVGLSFSLTNSHSINAYRTFALVSSENSYVRFLTDSLYFGNIAGSSGKSTRDIAVFRLDPTCPDGEKIDLTIRISDSLGFGWISHATFEAYTPKMEATEIRIDDSQANNNGAFDNGETVTVEFRLTNNGRQEIHQIAAELQTDDPYFQIKSGRDEVDQVGIGETHAFRFQAALPADAPKAYLGKFNLNITTGEGYAPTLELQINNIHGFYDDFESGVNGWVHASYGTTSNNHDDWQWGTPAGQAGDPDKAFSGTKCWGNDMGWDAWEGTSWDGLYQANEYNYLRSPVIDCSDMADVGLKLMRWLTIKANDFARIRVNNEIVWQSPQVGKTDTRWTEQIVDISRIADHNPAVVITFELQSNATNNGGGWTLDDVIVADGLVAGSSGLEPGLEIEPDCLFDPYPNPSNGVVTLRFRTSAEGQADLTLFDRNGRKVKTLVTGNQPAGMHQVTWDATGSNGQSMPSGIYFYQLKAGKSALTKRLVLIR